MIFRRKPKRVIHSWEDLSDALVAFWNAELHPDGARLEVAWKEDKEALVQPVFVRAADVSHLGLVMFLEAPLGVPATDVLTAQATHAAHSLLVGGIAAQHNPAGCTPAGHAPELVLRHTCPVEGVPYSAVHAMIESLAAGAHTLTAELRS